VRAFILILFLPIAIFGQNQPNKVDQVQPKEILSDLKVRSRVGMEYEYTDSSFYSQIEKLKSDTQSVSTYSTIGLLLNKSNYWSYASSGTLKKSYEYDSKERLQSAREMIGDSLVREEQFLYSEHGTLLDWTIVQGKNKYSQEYFYNKEGHTSLIKVKDKKRSLVRRDSILYQFDNQGRPVKEWSFDIKDKLADSLTYVYGDDTLSKKMLIIDDQLSFIYYQIKFGAFVFDRVEEYTEGHFMGVYYRMYDKNGNLLKERNIHHYTNLNYTKNYLYNKEGLLIEKQVFKDTYEPTHVVLYFYEFY
jgi:hypothetical protein